MTEQVTHIQFDTSVGSFVVELYYMHAPKTCENFIGLVKKGFYDGIAFHRIIANFMIQGGDPTGTGRYSESIWGHPFEDEITRKLRFTGAGIVAMANSGPNTNGCQFFVTLAPTPWLDGKYTIFGRISEGMGTVNHLGHVPTDTQDRPLSPVKIIRARCLSYLCCINSFIAI
ncbi:peptidyl prolyl cis-trans isomerase [Blastocystis sp. subtype 4]|uniref:peptidyl prolyl cis-trans isomerase n=1 Tax=Blastocystis sp. subtype 4 TaxID=944170 RepID=UPI000711850E|nr:peptidyl prolyl cis-trans isomerase [Blastocystis sp. subtype 4]KNB44845.1 peptidyl prolyl cis-trans isomerase [Blastocystis sp. subtype 4]|eukprot:XP_014528287.1 peptidyl prolyl cis-trans isomerase [Blastocystis sp. subtype 4]